MNSVKPPRTPKLASFKEEQRPYGSEAASHLGAAVLAHVVDIGTAL